MLLMRRISAGLRTRYRHWRSGFETAAHIRGFLTSRRHYYPQVWRHRTWAYHLEAIGRDDGWPYLAREHAWFGHYFLFHSACRAGQGQLSEDIAPDHRRLSNVPVLV